MLTMTEFKNAASCVDRGHLDVGHGRQSRLWRWNLRMVRPTCHLKTRRKGKTAQVVRIVNRIPYSSNQLGEECSRRNNNRPSLEREAINRLVRCIKEDLERIGHLQLSLKVLQGR